MAATQDPSSRQGTQVSDAPPAGGSSSSAATEVLRQPSSLSGAERRLLSDLFAIVSEHAAGSGVDVDRARVQDAFVFAC
jgi:hypothetical protein